MGDYCVDCGVIITTENSYAYNVTGGKRNHCKVCDNKDKVQRNVNKKLWAIEYLGGECVICGYKGYYGAIDFHHVDRREKEYGWKKIQNRSIEVIRKELDKCVPVCATHHREIHGGLWPEYIVISEDPLPKEKEKPIHTLESFFAPEEDEEVIE